MPKTRVSNQDIRDATITDADIAAANKDGAKNVASLRTLAATVTTQAFSDAPDAGTALTASSSDHKHGMPAAPAGGSGDDSWMAYLYF